MLESPDLKKRFLKALKDRPDVKQTHIAKAAGVTAQAVNGWKSTGQIDPRHFPVLVQLLGKPLEYWHGTAVAPERMRVSDSAAVAYLPASQSMTPTVENMSLAVEVTRYWIDFHGLQGAVEDHIPLLAMAHELVIEVRRSGAPGTVLDLSKKLAARLREEKADDGERGAGAGSGGTSGPVRGRSARERDT